MFGDCVELVACHGRIVGGDAGVDEGDRQIELPFEAGQIAMLAVESPELRTRVEAAVDFFEDGANGCTVAAFFGDLYQFKLRAWVDGVEFDGLFVGFFGFVVAFEFEKGESELEVEKKWERADEFDVAFFDVIVAMIAVDDLFEWAGKGESFNVWGLFDFCAADEFAVDGDGFFEFFVVEAFAGFADFCVELVE